MINWEKEVVNSYKTIEKLLPNINLELILVNDGSTKNVDDKNISFLKENIADFTFVNQEQNRGKGFAVRAGFKKAKFENVVFTDIDFPYTYNSFLEIVEGLDSGADIISFTRENEYYNQIPWFRKVVSKLLRFVMKNTFKLPISDTQAGLKGFSKKGKELLLETTVDRYLFDIELFKLAGKRKDIEIKCYKANLRDGIELASLSFSLLLKEFKTFYKIWRM